MSTVLSLLALVVALVALGLVLTGRRSTSADDGEQAVPEDARALRHEVAALQAEYAQALKHLAVVRYDAFDDIGGRLSWSLSLLDDHGDGVVVTSIHGRSDARVYAKNLSGWACEQQLSQEEQQAITLARR